MSELPLSADPQVYLENLMRAGQDAMKQFDDALATATGVQTEESLSFRATALPLCLDRRPSARISQTGVAALEYIVPAIFLRWRPHRRCAGKGRQAIHGRIMARAAILRSSQADLFAGLEAAGGRRPKAVVAID